ncbi:MAG: flagellar export protein FliJ [Gammaproteobacteria bacterium]|nr:flagellar export protein FliJ [Gammaproteobacteria bacterium]
MARRNRMQILQKLAGHTEAEASRRLAERLKLLDADERRLEQIRGYLADYSGNIQNTAMTIGALRSNRGFMERLRNAVDEQRGAVEIQRHQAEQHAAQWRTARARSLALERLGERIEQREQQRRDRIEQARLDEIANQSKT